MHAHPVTGSSRHTHGSRHKGKLRAVLALTASFLAVELTAALVTGSLSLLADAVHMFIDVGAVLLSLTAIWLAERPATSTKTYGYYRIEILAAMINGVVLGVLALAILWQAWERLRAPREVTGWVMVLVAMAGLAVNLAALRLLHAGSRESLNVKGAYLEVLGDALSSGAVLVAGVVIAITGWSAADALAAGVIGILILPRMVALLSQALNVLLEGVPPHLDIGEIETAMCQVDGVRRVHDLHVWTLTSGREAMSAHVVADPRAPADRLLNDLHVLLHARFGIDHTTIQVESEPSPLVQITPSSRAG